MGWTLPSNLWIWQWFLEDSYFPSSECWVSSILFLTFLSLVSSYIFWLSSRWRISLPVECLLNFPCLLPVKLSSGILYFSHIFVSSRWLDVFCLTFPFFFTFFFTFFLTFFLTLIYQFTRLLSVSLFFSTSLNSSCQSSFSLVTEKLISWSNEKIKEGEKDV